MFTLNGVACLSKRSCIAVGDDNVRGFAVRWDGAHWSVAKGNLDISETAVSCTARLKCVVVGFDWSRVRVWTGTRWVVHSTGLSSHREGNFSGISCIASRCVAVGTTFNAKEFEIPVAARNL